MVKQATGKFPVVLSIADAGFAGYASLITTSRKLVDSNPGLVQRFVDATIEGWHSYLEGDPSPGNALILKANPEMSQAVLDYGRDMLRSHGIVESGDAVTMGIGAMTDARWSDFFYQMVAAKLYPPSLDYTQAYTLKFITKPK